MKSRLLRWVAMWRGAGLALATAEPASNLEDDVVLMPTVTVDEK